MIVKKNFVINFRWICFLLKIYIICCVPAQILYWKKSCSWDKGQNASSQSDCRIFKSIISQEQTDETVSFLTCWCEFSKIKSWLKIFWLRIVQNGCCQSGLWTIKFTVSEEWTDGINWFFACWYKFMQIKRCFKIFGIGIVKNGCGQCVGRTVKLTLSEEWTVGIRDFLQKLKAGQKLCVDMIKKCVSLV